MLDARRIASRLWRRLHSRFRSGDALAAADDAAADICAPPKIIPRYCCRFEYFDRPEGLRRRQFEAACLLRAEHNVPFVDAHSLVIRGRNGVGIWWWDATASSAGQQDSRRVNRDVPESLCADLSDGWYHLQLESGFEARLIRRNMVIASAWRRSAFGPVEWQDFVARADPDAAATTPLPATFFIDPAKLKPRPRGGTVLRRPMTQVEKGLLAALLLASILGGWWQGQAVALSQTAQTTDAEADRLERFVTRYPLFSQIRADLKELDAAQDALGTTTAATDLATIFAQIANAGLSISTMQLDREQLRLSLQTGSNIDQLRTLATQIEALPGFVHVAAQEGEEDGVMMLSAEVGP